MKNLKHQKSNPLWLVIVIMLTLALSSGCDSSSNNADKPGKLLTNFQSAIASGDTALMKTCFDQATESGTLMSSTLENVFKTVGSSKAFAASASSRYPQIASDEKFQRLLAMDLSQAVQYDFDAAEVTINGDKATAILPRVGENSEQEPETIEMFAKDGTWFLDPKSMLGGAGDAELQKVSNLMVAFDTMFIEMTTALDESTSDEQFADQLGKIYMDTMMSIAMQ